MYRWAVTAACLVSSATLASGPLVLYFNESGERVAIALGKLRAAVAAERPASGEPVRIEHVLVDYDDPDSIRRSLRAAAARRPAAIIAAAAPTAQLALEESLPVPVIYGMYQDPTAIGMAQSFNHPGGLFTGLTFYRSDEGKRLELLREIAPRARTLGVLVDESWYLGPRYHFPSAAVLGDMARTQFAFEVHYFHVDTLGDIERLARNARAKTMDAWYVPPNRGAFDHPEELARALSRFRRPAVYAYSLGAQHGGLLAYQAVFEDPFASWAKILGLVLDGYPVADIPIERPSAFELSVNLKAAREQGIDLPRSILLRATHFY